MTRMVRCKKLDKELAALTFPPMKGELGQRIFESISQEAWKEWLAHSIMVINENRLNPADPETQKILRAQMEQFLFGSGAEKPAGYVPPK